MQCVAATTSTEGFCEETFRGNGCLNETNLDKVMDSFLRESVDVETYVAHNELVKEAVERSRDRFSSEMAKL